MSAQKLLKIPTKTQNLQERTEPNLKMKKAASETRFISIAAGDVETSLVAFKASAFPLERRVAVVAVGSNGPDEDRQQVHGAVEAV